MQSGSGPSPAPAHQPPPGRSPPSSAASPSSSSSAVSAPNHLGLESMQQRQQQQQQLAHRQALLLAQQQNHHQQQQLRKAETDQSHLPYQAGGTFGVSGAGFLSNPVQNSSQSSKKYGSIPYQPSALQLREENQSKGLGTGQQMQNTIHQAYLQFALQSAQQKSDGNFAMLQQGKTNMASQSGRDEDMIMNKLKMQELMSPTASKSQMPMFKRTVEQFANVEKQMEQGRANHDQRNDLKPFPTDAHLASVNMIRPAQSLLPPANVQNFASSQLEMVQMQAMQAWAKEHNIDLSVPANLNLIAQILPLMQSNGVPAGQKPTETSSMIQQSLPTSKQQAMQSPAGSESSAYGNSTSDLSVGQHMKRRQMLPLSSNSAGDTPSINNSMLHMKQQQFAENSKVSQNERVVRPPTVRCSGAQDTHLENSSGSMNHTLEKSNYNSTSMVNKMQTQFFRPLQQANQSIPLLPTPSNNITGAHNPTDTGSAQTSKQHFGFTKKQLHVLKAQILAFRRLKRGERSLPPEVLQAISDSASDYQPPHGPSQPENVNHDSTKAVITSNIEHRRIIESNSQTEQSASATKRHTQMKEEPFSGEEKTAFASQMQVSVDLEKEPAHMGSIGKLEESSSNVKSEQESEKGSQNSSSKGNYHVVKEKVTPADGGSMAPGCVKMPAPTNTTESSRDGVLKKYHGPIFDFSSFTRRPDTLASTATNYSSNLTLAYDVKDLLYEEAKSVLTKNRTENLKKISWLLAFNLERKIIKPDLVVQLQIEEKKLKLFNLQARLRDEVEHQQEEIMTMSDRQYRKFVRQCEQQRVELARQVQQLQRASREKLLKSVFQWRKKLLESHWAIRDARTTRNRGIAKYHERMMREFSKREDEDRNKRMEALKNNDVDRYREMLLEQQTSIQGDAAQRYAVLSSFLTQTEEYLLRLGGKITDAKSNQEVEEAANAAASAARAQGLSSEEVRAAAACAGEEVMIRNQFSEMNAPKDSSVNKYYNLAHAVTERVTRQPSMLRTGTLRDYQLVGLQWMLSLYNNKLNGILADEMGLGKTVQVMALIAYLMEFKGNYGPHLIIVPNAVLVNWKSELLNWLPSISCIFYVGSKDERSKLFSQEVCAVKFNVLVTTYEFIMYDRSKLSKIDWKYIVIDEAQRMKDRESVLARDLDRYRCQRRLLLTGTPLQNDLKELWSLLNLLLPEVFDNCKAFHDWFSKPFQKDGPHNEEDDEWLETEKKVIIIHRLHQILEPFMLRRRLEDVEGSLPRKIPIVVRCRMSAIQGAIYDWIKPTGTIRVDPEDEMRRVQRNPLYQVKTYKNLNNKCMELRKVCNHPLLNYPYLSNYSKDFIVRSCGKLWVLDRILIKLHRAGHRVLLFSTMTKLLDILEEYLQWRRLVYRRIDGSTCLEDRESAIVDFNSPDSKCVIFLLSIRAAGRGLNLQTADTVVIYDPDPNPQNEEQAVARAHRIGQKREVKVIYMEAVVDKISSYQKEDELRSGIAGDSDDDLAGRDRYMGSIESLIRSNIQQYKLDMADEVINAGRFDQRTTHEERRMTLEMLLHDEERYQENVHDVPSMQEVNRMIARNEEEVVLFDQMDEDLDWTADMVKHSEVPKWLRVSSSELDAVTASLSKKPLKNILSGNVVTEPNALICDPSSSKMERRRGRPRKNYQVYQELDDEYGEDSDIDSEERNASEEEVEVGGFNDEEFIDDDVLRSHKIHVTQGMGRDKRGPASSQTMVRRSTNTSSGSGRLSQPQTPVLSSQKFGSLSLLEARPGLPLKKMSEELEEGEIAVSGDSHLDLQQSGSQLHDHEDGEEDQQVLQPKVKRKRSIRIHPRYNVEKDDKQSDIAKIAARGSKLPKVGNEYDKPSRTGKLETCSDAGLGKHSTTNLSLNHKHNTPVKRISPMQISGRLSYFSGTAEDGNGHSKESWHNRANNSGGSMHMSAKMSDITQRKCKNVISKLQMRIHKDGNQIVPIFYDWWRRKEKPTFAIGATSGNVLDLQRIEQRVDNLEYSGVTDFIADVQSMLKTIVRHCSHTYEVKCEAEKLQALFFNIMKIAFPDSDFRQARNEVTFSNPRKPATTPAGSSHKLTANKIKQHMPINKLEKSSPLPRTSPHMATPIDDEFRTKSTSSKQQKDSKLVSGSWTERASEPSQYPPHPGDLVICKKKRKERDKSSVKQRIGPASPLNPSRFGPLSPTSSGGMSSGPSSSINHFFRRKLCQSIENPNSSHIGCSSVTSKLLGFKCDNYCGNEFLTEESYNVLGYDDKILDGFYDLYGVSIESTFSEMPSLMDLQQIPISDNIGWEVALVNRKEDADLSKLEQKALLMAKKLRAESLDSSGSLLVQEVAFLVADYMGGKISDPESMLNSYQNLINHLMANIGSIVLPLGHLTVGLARHRALMFKVLADSLGISCRLVKGKQYTGSDDSALATVKLNDGRDYIVDLMSEPGTLIPSDGVGLINEPEEATIMIQSFTRVSNDTRMAISSSRVADSTACSTNESFTKQGAMYNYQKGPNSAGVNPCDLNHQNSRYMHTDMNNSTKSPTTSNDVMSKTPDASGKSKHPRSPSWTEGISSSTVQSMKLKNVSEYMINAAKENPKLAQKLQDVLLESGVAAPPNLFTEICTPEIEDPLTEEMHSIEDKYKRKINKPELKQKTETGGSHGPFLPQLPSHMLHQKVNLSRSQMDATKSAAGLSVCRNQDSREAIKNPVYEMSDEPLVQESPLQLVRHMPVAAAAAATAAVVASSMVVAAVKSNADLNLEVPVAAAATATAAAVVATTAAVSKQYEHLEPCSRMQCLSGGDKPNLIEKNEVISVNEQQASFHGNDEINTKERSGDSHQEMDRTSEKSTGTESTKSENALQDVVEFEIAWEDIILGERIGLGSFGEVYHGDWHGTEVAVKRFLHQDISSDALEEFISEVRIMKRLRHPNVVLFMGAVTCVPNLSIVTEFLHRGSLFRLIHRPNNQLDERRRLRMALDIARGMNYLHNCTPIVVHRDLKSPNLLVDKNWVVKVCDFGLSRMKHNTFLSSRSTAGTAEWMAPEVLRNEPSDEKCDVFSFGVILWELCTLQQPWEGMNPMQVVGAVGFQDRHLDIPDDMDPIIAGIIRKCWQINPKMRPSFTEIMAALKALQKPISSNQGLRQKRQVESSEKAGL